MNTWILIFILCFQCINGYGLVNGTETEDNKRYLIACDVAVSKIPENDVPVFESTLSKLFCLVFERATHERLGQSVMRMSRTLNFSSELCKIETLENKAFGSHSQLIFTVSYNDLLVDATVATKEISRLSLSHLSASVAYPIVSIYAMNQPERYSNVKWWLILIIIGCCLLVCVFGWLILFIYYNTCALPMRQYRSYSTERKPNIEPTIEIKNVSKVDDPVNLLGIKTKPADFFQNDNISTATILSNDRITVIPDIKQSQVLEPQPILNEQFNNETRTKSKSDNKNVVEERLEETTIAHQVPDPEHGVKRTENVKVLRELLVSDPWNPYYAGDRVEAIRLQESRHYPQPALPTQDGVLNLRTVE